MSLIKHHIDTLHLRADAPFPSDLREMVAMYKEKHSEKRSHPRPDRGSDPAPAPSGAIRTHLYLVEAS